MTHFARSTIASLLGLALALPAAARAASLTTFWDSPSRLMPREASEVLARELSGEPVAARELFEAEKYLKTGGGVSLGEFVLREALTRFLGERVQAPPGTAWVRALPPILHWLDASGSVDTLKIRGESVQIAVLNSEPDRAATVLWQRTIQQDWRLCDGAPCFTSDATPLRSGVSFVLSSSVPASVPEPARASDLLFATELAGWIDSAVHAGTDWHAGPACDPAPLPAPARRRRGWTFRHEAARVVPGNANRILCAFRVHGAHPSARIAYLTAEQILARPLAGARSAIVNNPLEFSLYDREARR